MTTEEKNVLISQFMGNRYEDNKNSHESSEYYFQDCELEYHSNWSWIMPVLDKIENMGFITTIRSDKEFHTVVIWNYEGQIHEGRFSDKKEAILEAIIKLIESNSKS